MYSICQQIWKTQHLSQDWKRSVSIPIPMKGNANECLNYHTIACISHASKVMLKILQARPQQYMNRELPDVQSGFRRGRGTRDQIANIHWIIERAREFQKYLYFVFKFLTMKYWGESSWSLFTWILPLMYEFKWPHVKQLLYCEAWLESSGFQREISMDRYIMKEEHLRLEGIGFWKMKREKESIPRG